MLPLLQAACVGRPIWPLLPVRMREALQSSARTAAREDMRQQFAFSQAAEALNGAKIPFLVLKGAALASLLYPSPHLRPRIDTDLLFADRGAADAASTVLARLGYRRHFGLEGGLVNAQYTMSLPQYRGGHCLDIHWRVSNSRRLAGLLPFAQVSATAIRLPHQRVPVLCPSLPHMMIHACLHRLAHQKKGEANRLIWLYDIHLLACEMDSAQWDTLTTECRLRGCARVCLWGLQATQDHFKTPVSARFLSAAQALIGSEPLIMDKDESRLQYDIAELQAIPTWSGRIEFLRESLFPRIDYMMQRDGLTSSLHLPFSYIRRICKGIYDRVRK
jgi:hypothetical protein